jgi:hypothetical protein
MKHVWRRTLSTLLSLSILHTSVVLAKPNAVPAKAQRQSSEITMTLLRAMDLLPRPALPEPQPIADQTPLPEGALKPLRDANDADTIQTLYRRSLRERQAGLLQFAALGATTTSLMNGDFNSQDRLNYRNDSLDVLAIPDDASRLAVPAWTADPRMTDIIYRQIVIKLAITLYRQELGRYPEGLDALTTGRKNYFQDALELFPYDSPYAKLASSALNPQGLPAPKSLRWTYNVSTDGQAFLLGARRSPGFPGSTPDAKLPIVSSRQPRGELPLLSGTMARRITTDFQQYCAQHTQRR